MSIISEPSAAAFRSGVTLLMTATTNIGRSSTIVFAEVGAQLNSCGGSVGSHSSRSLLSKVKSL